MAWIELTVNNDKLYVNMDLVATIKKPGTDKATQLTMFQADSGKALVIKVAESPEEIMAVLNGPAAKSGKSHSAAR